MKHRGRRSWCCRSPPFDRLIAFWPALLPVYLSLWLYIALPVLLREGPARALGFSLGLRAHDGASRSSVFWFMPTAIPNFTIDTSARAPRCTS